jgi:hypothetical protein
MTLAGWPTVIAEIAFNADPNSTTTASWTDVSTKLNAFTSHRGRQYELAQSDVGTAGVSLDNRDGRFDPSNTSSPYYPNVKIYRQMRIRANYAGTTYSIVNGFVERWPQAWSDSGFGSSNATMVDGLAVLGARTFSRVLEETTLADNPIAYWPLQEESGETSAVDLTGLTGAAVLTAGKYGAPPAAQLPTFGDTTSLVDGDTCVTFRGRVSGGFRSTSVLAAPTRAITAPSSGFSVVAWVRAGTSASYTDNQVIVCQFDRAEASGWYLGLDNGAPGARLIAEVQTTTNFCVTNDTVTLADNGWHHVGMVYTEASTYSRIDLYKDGAHVALGTSSRLQMDSIISLQNPTWLGGQICPGLEGQALLGGLAHVALYTTALATASISNYYTVGLNAGLGEGPGARISRILSLVPWRASSTTTDLDDSTFQGAIGYATSTALDLVQQVASDAQGVFYVNASGSAQWQSRRSRMAQTAATYTFGDSTGELPYTEIAFDFDPTYVYNDAEITLNGGIVSVALNTASQISYFDRPYATTVYLQAQTQADSLASWIVNTHAQPAMRPSVIEIEPSANVALWPAALGLEIGTRVTVKRRAKGSTNTISIPCYVEGVEHAVDTSSWRTRFTLSPVGSQVLIWDDPVAGFWDTDVWGY